ncbi:MAG: hypothetical protein NXI25_13345 [bacterium]|nr:hypothetical protein [bacterium]
MKKSPALFFAFMLGLFMVSCSGGESDNNNNSETASNTEATEVPAKANKSKMTIPEGQSTEDFVFAKLKKGLDKRGVELSADQETALQQLISENDLTPETLKTKRAEIIQKIQAEILTAEQKASMKK